MVWGLGVQGAITPIGLYRVIRNYAGRFRGIQIHMEFE